MARLFGAPKIACTLKVRAERHICEVGKMSTLIVEVCTVDSIEPHPNADRLAIATVKGWKTAVSMNPETGETFLKAGDKCIYFPPDAVLPSKLALTPEEGGRLGVANYCSRLPKQPDGTQPDGFRVRAARLRSVSSFGTIDKIRPELGDSDWEVGTDVAEYFGITKYVPPVKTVTGDAAPDHPLFHAYTEIENINNFPTGIPDGTIISISEKIHGTNCRIGLILADPEQVPDNVVELGGKDYVFVAGSHRVNRKEFDASGRRSMYWEPLTDHLKQIMFACVRDQEYEGVDVKSLVIFGEIFGPGVQDMTYGVENKTFRIFDIAVNGTYLDTYIDGLSKDDYVPELYCGAYSREIVDQFVDGPTTVCSEDINGSKFKGREGIVVRSVREQNSPAHLGRMIFKAVSADYLGRKGAQDNE